MAARRHTSVSGPWILQVGPAPHVCPARPAGEHSQGACTHMHFRRAVQEGMRVSFGWAAQGTCLLLRKGMSVSHPVNALTRVRVECWTHLCALTSVCVCVCECMCEHAHALASTHSPQHTQPRLRIRGPA